MFGLPKIAQASKAVEGTYDSEGGGGAPIMVCA